MTLYSVISVTKLYDHRTVCTLQSDPFCPSSKYLLLHISGYTRFWLMRPQVHLKATFQFLLYCQVTDSFIFLNINPEMENLTGPVCLLAPDYVQICWRAYVFAAAAAAAKSLQSCPTLCNPRDGSPPGSPAPGILQARTLEWVAISFSNAWKWKGKVKSLSRVWLLQTPWTAAYQAPPSMGFFRQVYWSGLPWNQMLISSLIVYEYRVQIKYKTWQPIQQALWAGRLPLTWGYEQNNYAIIVFRMIFGFALTIPKDFNLIFYQVNWLLI